MFVFHFPYFSLNLLHLRIHFNNINLELLQGIGLKFSFMDEGLEVIESHFTVFFSGEFALILMLTVKRIEGVLLIDVVSKLNLLVLGCHRSFLEKLIHLPLVLCD